MTKTRIPTRLSISAAIHSEFFRNRWNTADLQCTDSKKGQWFLVETNYDHWKSDKDKRRKMAEKALRKIGQKAMTHKNMLWILSLHPVENK
ncbi:unnamed protein product [Gongylonema pulchrum]|uniref:Integrase n=1 Tax=Gongylonema pulchrum TaxID=637853 RepID=A0A183DLB6_9BILA|nr:unnamed protein product [Gongylonema pulchrum]